MGPRSFVIAGRNDVTSGSHSFWIHNVTLETVLGSQLCEQPWIVLVLARLPKHPR